MFHKDVKANKTTTIIITAAKSKFKNLGATNKRHKCYFYPTDLD